MPTFIITHGSVILARPLNADGKPVSGGKQRSLVIGDSIELTPEERAHMDPSGTQLVTPEVFAEMKKSADAAAALEEASKKEAPKAKSMGLPAKTLKALAELKKPAAQAAPKGASK